MTCYDPTGHAIDALVALGNEDYEAFWEATFALLNPPEWVEWTST